MKQVNDIKIECLIDTSKNPVSVDDFKEKLFLWLESNDWYFGGKIYEDKK